MNNSKFDFTKVTTKNYKELYHANGNLYYLDEILHADGRYWIVDGFTEEEVKNAIINGLSIIFIEGAPKNPFVLEKQPENACIAYGHSIDEYYDVFGEAYQEGEYWDFSKEDFEGGAIEIDPSKVYWYVKDKTGEWRYFETGKNMWIKLYSGAIFQVHHYHKSYEAYVVYTGEKDLITGRNILQDIDYTVVEKVAETKEEL